MNQLASSRSPRLQGRLSGFEITSVWHRIAAQVFACISPTPLKDGREVKV
jgi:hypothetical protein